ncbi:GrpB family protein [Sediminibacillus dalangtanensis]|uniref:GrpB family protein n=1 Tax=Sediminibacillus dalangtanensis TaxID=2729421 RepID=A0ABX7VQD1_9BACI|nr:GrpB family protein [Sediminibacillus dalangtanensis]QTM99109.1 GrpB family protein [Sediminibacillus dalangtanensis]
MRNVEVVSYKDQWPNLFLKEAKEIKEVFGDELIDVHHIGSTSVPGLAAKPIIDIMPVVRDIEKVDRYNRQMAAIGYEGKGEFGIPGRRYFRKGGENRSHHVHIFQQGDKGVTRHLAFRDFLRTHPHVARKYGAKKQELAGQFPCNIESYMDGKNQLAQEIEQKALAWYQNN